MAGAGHKLWSTGDTVTAAQFNTYIQDQVVGVYADSTARDAAFGGTGEPTLAEGMVCYLSDTNKIQTYNGSAWVDVSTDPAGSDHQVQFNDNGSFGADANFTYDGAKLTIAVPVFASGKVQTGATSFTQEPWSASTIALGDFGSVGTQGGYASTLAWNWERGTDSGFHHLNVNSYNQAGGINIDNGGIEFLYQDDYNTTHTAAPTVQGTWNATELNVKTKIRLGTDATNGPFLDSEDDELRIENNFGYLDLGPKNSSANHIYGSLPVLFIGIEGSAKFGFTGDEFYPYNNNATELGISTNRWERLHVNEIYADIGSQTDPSYTFTGDTNTGMYSTNHVLRFTTNGTQKGLFSSSGFYAIKAVSTGTYALWASSGYLVAFSSSERYKENIQDMPREEWEKIYNLNARTFDWKEDGSVEIDPNRGKADHGFIAEEVVEHLPQVISYDKIDHEDPESEYQIQAVNYGELTPYLVEAVKDLRQRIETLEGN